MLLDRGIENRNACGCVNEYVFQVYVVNNQYLNKLGFAVKIIPRKNCYWLLFDLHKSLLRERQRRLRKSRRHCE